MGGLRLEVFKVAQPVPPSLNTPFASPNLKIGRTRSLTRTQFGTYLLFPIGIMYYFGANLDNRFAVEGFWPKAEESNKIPHSREEIKAEYERIVERQRLLKERREAARKEE